MINVETISLVERQSIFENMCAPFESVNVESSARKQLNHLINHAHYPSLPFTSVLLGGGGSGVSSSGNTSNPHSNAENLYHSHPHYFASKQLHPAYISHHGQVNSSFSPADKNSAAKSMVSPPTAAAAAVAAANPFDYVLSNLAAAAAAAACSSSIKSSPSSTSLSSNRS